MNKSFLALTLALSIIPIAAGAQAAPPAPPARPTAAQRQAMSSTFRTFGQQEKLLHDRMRSQMLATLSPIHRTAVANMIGQLAISAKPNPGAVAAQLDALLGGGEKQQILNAHAAFAAQSKTLHEQMRAQLQKEMPAPMPMMKRMHENGGAWKHARQAPDAGMLLLRVLSDHPMGMRMMRMGFHGGAP